MKPETEETIRMYKAMPHDCEYYNECPICAVVDEIDSLREKLNFCYGMIQKFRTCGDAHCTTCKPLEESLKELSELIQKSEVGNDYKIKR